MRRRLTAMASGYVPSANPYTSDAPTLETEGNTYGGHSRKRNRISQAASSARKKVSLICHLLTLQLLLRRRHHLGAQIGQHLQRRVHQRVVFDVARARQS